MKYSIKVMGISVTNWNDLRVAIFGDAKPIYEEFGGQVASYEFSEQVTPANLGPLFIITQIS
jgi:hypothetical protein